MSDIQVRSTPPFKLKDKESRRYQGINLVKQFGFVPETIIIEKVQGYNNTIVVRAVLTKDELQKEKEILKVIKAKDGKSSSKK
jgi:hypothetical protein